MRSAVGRMLVSRQTGKIDHADRVVVELKAGWAIGSLSPPYIEVVCIVLLEEGDSVVKQPRHLILMAEPNGRRDHGIRI